MANEDPATTKPDCGKMQFLLEQGDITINLLFSFTFQYAALVVAILLGVLTVGNVLKATETYQFLVIAYILTWFAMRFPPMLLFVIQEYTDARYGLVNKLITEQNFETEKIRFEQVLKDLMKREKDLFNERSWNLILILFCLTLIIYLIAEQSVNLVTKVTYAVVFAGLVYTVSVLEKKVQGELHKIGACETDLPKTETDNLASTSPQSSVPQKIQIGNLRLIHSHCLRMLEFEDKRWTDFGEKAINVSGFFGVAATISSTILPTVFGISNTSIKVACIGVYLFVLLFVVLGFWNALKTVQGKRFRCDPDPVALVQLYYAKDEISTLKTLSASLSAAWKDNTERGNEKAKYLGWTILCAQIGLFLLLILFLLVSLSVIWQ